VRAVQRAWVLDKLATSGDNSISIGREGGVSALIAVLRDNIS